MNKEYEILQSSKISRTSGFIAIFLIIFLFFAPWWAGRADIRLLSEIFLYLSLASLWNLLAGYCGLVSVGQQAFVGLGGYLLFALTIFSGFNPFAAILVSGILGALISLPVAFLIFRLRGAYFAIGTWVVAEIFRLSFAQIQSLGGGSGSSLPVGIVKSIASSISSNICILNALSFSGLFNLRIATEFTSSREIVSYSFNKIYI